jgi:hypothetical protein
VRVLATTKTTKGGSELEELLAWHIKVSKLPPPEREYRFCERRWRFDFAWPALMIAAECEGGTWVNGAHNRGAHFESDCDKYNEASLLGWQLLRFTASRIESGKAIELLKRALAPSG